MAWTVEDVSEARLEKWAPFVEVAKKSVLNAEASKECTHTVDVPQKLTNCHYYYCRGHEA
jgi:hypothetical protein